MDDISLKFSSDRWSVLSAFLMTAVSGKRGMMYDYAYYWDAWHTVTSM